MFFITFFLKNTKIFLISGLIIAALSTGWKLVSVIQDNAVKDAALEIQRNTIEEKDKAIKSLEDLIKLNESILEERDIQLDDLNAQLEGLIENLGDDADEQAPESIKELFRRLQ